MFEVNSWDIVYILGGSHTNLGPRPRLLVLNQALPLGSLVTCIKGQVTCIIGPRTGGAISHPTGILQWDPLSVAQPFPRSTQNIDVVSPFNFPIPRCKLSNVLCHINYQDNTMSVTVIVQCQLNNSVSVWCHNITL